MLRRAPLLRLGFAAASLCSTPPVLAQQFGQWSWDASAGFVHRAYQNRIGGQRVGSIQEQDLSLSLGVNGFIVHPAVLRLRLDVDAQLSTYRSSRALDARRSGFRGNLAFLPQSLTPFSLYGSHQLYDYSKVTAEDPLNLVGTPDTATSLGGRLRLRKGPLLGTLLGYDRSWLRFLTPGARPGGQELGFVDWARPSRTFQRHGRIERRVQQFGAVDFETRDLTASFDQRGRLFRSSRWESYVTGTHRSLSYGGSAPASYDTVRTAQTLVTTRGPRGDAFDLSYDGGLTRGAGMGAFQSHTLLGRYLWRPQDRWSVTPYLGYAFQQASGSRVSSPQAGVSAAWHRRTRNLDLALNPSLGLLVSKRSGPTPLEEWLLAASLGASLGHGTDAGLRKELEATWSHNQLRLAGRPQAELPDLGTSLVGVGTEESLRARLALRKRWGSWLLSGYSDWSHRGPSGSLAATSFSSDNLTHTIQIAGRRFSLSGGLGDSRVHATAPQRTSYRVSSLSVRPWYLLELSATYRADSRRLSLAPSVDGRRAEASAQVLVGAFVVQARGFLTTERAAAFPERTDRGLVINLARRFGGWLPIVTGDFGGDQTR